MKIIQCTHHDLDGVSSAIIMKHLFNVYYGLGKVHRFSVGYEDTNQLILNKLSTDPDDTFLIITDLRIETKFLKLLLNMKKIKRLLYIDHHEREDDRKGLEGLKYIFKEKFTYRWRKGYSATELCYQLAKERGLPTTSKLDNLVKCTDVYDEWKLNDSKFDEGFALNEVFWELSFFKFFDKMYDGLTWTDDVKEIAKIKINEQNEYFKENKKHIQILDLAKDRKLLISFNPIGKYTNIYTLKYDADLFLIFGHEKNDQFKFSVRSRNPYFDANEICQNMKNFLEGSKGGGHKGASGLLIPSKFSLEQIFDSFMKNLDSLYFI